MLPAAFEQQLYSALKVGPDQPYRVLVLGPNVESRINLACTSASLLDRRMANVQKLADRRQPERYLGAVYIIETTRFAFGCVLADFQPRVRRYKDAEVLLVPTLDYSPSEKAQFEKSMGQYLKRCEIAHINYFPLETHLFSLGDVHCNDLLYNPNLTDLIQPKLQLVAQQLVDVCSTLQIKPFVRFSKPHAQGTLKVPPQREYPAKIAEIVAQQLDIDAVQTSDFRPTLLILDRSVDLGAPLRHDLAFQPLALDALYKDFSPEIILNDYKGGDASNGSSKNGSSVNLALGGKGKEEGQGGTLSEDDKIWTSLRHEHIVTVTETLTRKIKDLRAQNPHFADPSAEASVGDVRNMLAALPTFVKERDSVALSLDIALACMAALEKLHLKEICEFEQAAALGSGLDNPDAPIPNGGERAFEARLADALAALLARDLPVDIKVRAFALYVLHRGGLCAQDFSRVQNHAGFSNQDMDVVTGLQYLGIPVVRSLDAMQPVIRSLVTEYAEQPLLFARARPGVCSVAEALMQNTLNVEEYPYAGSRPSRVEEQLNLASSLRNPRQRATWAQSVTSPVSAVGSLALGVSPQGMANPAEKTRVNAVVFVLGGVTPSEHAALSNLSEKNSQQIVVGGDDLLAPQKFIEFLTRLKTDRQHIGLEIDKEMQVPSHLYDPVKEPEQPKAAPVRKVPARTPAPSTMPATVIAPDPRRPVPGPVKTEKLKEKEKEKSETKMKKLRGAFKLKK